MRRHRVRLAALGTAAVLTSSSGAFAQTATVPGTTTPSVTTRHRIQAGGRTVAYTARAGLLPIRLNETGEPRGYIFFVAYTGGPCASRRTSATDIRMERRARVECAASAEPTHAE